MNRATPRHVPRLALTAPEAAESLGMGLTSFETYVTPYVRCIRPGRMKLYRLADLERWADENADWVLPDGVESDRQLDAPARHKPPGAGAGSRPTRPGTDRKVCDG